jgi:D-3-phosphoglycerate dehydrogenase
LEGHLLLTPHIAGLTRESAAAMGLGTAKQIVQLINGERPDHLVNPSVWESYCLRRQARDKRS